MFSISQLVETITENIDPNTTFIRIVYNDRHALKFNNDNYTTCFIRPILITTKNHEEIDLTNIAADPWIDGCAIAYLTCSSSALTLRLHVKGMTLYPR